ncbi:hypothetical protein PV10_05252 [Exophiala mesophila]|uniref:Glucose-methanol-choline oxidoreductase N-terminal domain-containing protein n=1 Tax=Exophiala mesophila TaxID=212818 RepID=A0A0D1ZHL1_EXOME|nr:uncharacterized protein PV10_05252 [Exophiala mesophila]KIV94097.1 hypothetical protein PV10_05252 [Exophiala mesophila]
MAHYSHEKHGDMDIIFAGGGTAACVAAGRLAAADPTLKILLIEQGPNNFEEPAVVHPALYLSHLSPDSKTALFYKSRPSSHLDGREAVVPAGGTLGGGSSINFMMYTRCQSIDMDAWKTPGWTAREMRPVFNKLETFHQDEQGIDKNKHGYEGPIHISSGGFRSKSSDVFINTVKQMGFDEIVDLQDLDQVGGFSRWQRYVSPDGKRQDTAHCYIHPLLQDGKHPNLHILVNSQVIRIVFDGEQSPPRVTGVEYQTKLVSQPATELSQPKVQTISAKKLVVVSAGALGSPQILERSGVGCFELLHKLGVDVVSDLPGVGENYQDHHLCLYPYHSSLPPEETLDDIFSSRMEVATAAEKKDHRLGWNAIDICSKLRMTDEDAKALGTDFEADWQRDFAPHPTRPVMLCGMVNAFMGDAALVSPGQYFTLGAYTAYPYSRGSIHINSATDVDSGYDFDAGFLSHPSDIKKQVWAYKLIREIARRLPFFEGELEMGHPKLPGHTASEGFLPSRDRDRIQYSQQDDETIENWIRQTVNTTWHSLGTCAMKKAEEGGVVDGDLNVHGTTGLKVADLSICPANVGGNTNNLAIAVGEKAASIIARELGFKLELSAML